MKSQCEAGAIAWFLGIITGVSFGIASNRTLGLLSPQVTIAFSIIGILLILAGICFVISLPGRQQQSPSDKQ